MDEARNTHEQLRLAGGGVAITVAYGGARTDYVSGWHVYRVGANGQQIVTDPNAHWQSYGKKWFSATMEKGTFHERQKAALEKAKAWVAGQGWYDGEWVGNRVRDHVPKDINKRFPIRKKR